MAFGQRRRTSNSPSVSEHTPMRLLLINPSNPLVSIVKGEPLEPLPRVETAQPYGSCGPRQWEITIVDENLGAPDYQAMPEPDLAGITAFSMNRRLIGSVIPSPICSVRRF
jgi:hypothetical protein